MSIITDSIKNQAPQKPIPEGESVFGAGLRQGALNAGAGLAAAGGTALEALGATETAQGLYDKSAGLRADAAQIQLPVQSYKDVDSIGSALQYGVGLAGQSIPALGAGLVGAAVAKNPMMGATLASAPMAIGDVAMRQQEDPTIAATPASQRLLEAGATGLKGAVLSNAVPVAMGGKLMGRGVGEVAGTLGGRLASNVGEAVVGNAAAGALQEKMTQDSLSKLNPNRDTTGDNDAMMESAVGGAVMGAPFAGIGTVGDSMHGKRPAPRTDGQPLPGEVGGAGKVVEPEGEAPTILSRMKGLFKKSELTEAERIAKNQELVDKATLDGVAPEQQAAVLQASDNERINTVTKWVKDLYADSDRLTEEQRATLDKAVENLGDRTNQALVATMKLARDSKDQASDSLVKFADGINKRYEGTALEGAVNKVADSSAGQIAKVGMEVGGKASSNALGKVGEFLSGQKANARVIGATAVQLGSEARDVVGAKAEQLAGKTSDAASAMTKSAQSFYDDMGKRYGKLKGTEKKSEVAAGVRDAINNVIGPILEERRPGLMSDEHSRNMMADSLRKFMAVTMKDGTVDQKTMAHLNDLFGDETTTVLSELHSAVADGSDADATARFYNALNEMDGEQATNKHLTDIVSKNLLPELQESATTKDVQEAVGHLREYVSGEHAKNMPPAQAAFMDRAIKAELVKHFGDKTDAVISAFAKDQQGRAELSQKQQGKVAKDASRDIDENAYGTKADESGVNEVQNDRQYYGGGRDAKNPQFVLSEAAHLKTYGNDKSQAAKLLARARAENPDMDVSAVSAKQYARDHGLSTEDLQDRIDGNPDDYVMIKAEGMKRDGVTWKDVDRVKLDTHRFGESPSRLDTDAGVILDAKRVLNMYAQKDKLPYNNIDERGSMHRMARQFKEAIGGLSDLIGEAIEVPDHTVVARRGGKDITWGELKKESLIKNDGEQDKASAKLYADREAALKAGDMETVESIDAKIDAKIMAANDRNDDLVDGMPKTVAVNNERVDMDMRRELAGLSQKMGEQRDVIEKVMKSNGPRGDDPADLKRQALALEDMVERLKAEAERAPQKDLFSGQEQELWSKRAEAIRDAARVVTEAGGQRRLSIKERALIRDYLNIEKNYQRQLDRLEARRPSNRDVDMADRMMSEAPLDRNIHEAVAEHGDEGLGKVFAASRAMDNDNPLHDQNFATPKLDGSLPDAIVSAIDSKINRLENMKTDSGAKNKIAWDVGQKARGLYNKLGAMRKQDAALLASIVKDGKLTSVAETINELHQKYKNVEGTPAKKPNAFTQRVLGEGDLSATVAAIRATSDAGKVRQVIDSLVAHATNPRAKKVLDAANERMSRFLEGKDGESIAYSLIKGNGPNKITLQDMVDVQAYIDKTFAGTVDVAFERLLHAGEFSRSSARAAKGFNTDLLRVSVHALDPMSVAYHESLHAFLMKLRDRNLMDEASPLMKAADSPVVITKLRELLANEPDALKQIETSLEERAAYMYQFWAAGKLKVGEKPAGVLGMLRDFFNKITGMWTNDQRALHIMQYFHSGEYAKEMKNRSAVATSLMKGTSGVVESFKTMVEPINKLGEKIVATGDGRLRGTSIPALVELADKVYAPIQGERGDPGYMPAARLKRTQVMNDLSQALGGYDAAVITDALEAMQRGQKGATPEERQVVWKVRKTLDEMFTYMTDAGVEIGDLGYGKDYFPRVWDANAVLKDDKAFRAMLQQYKDAGKFNGSIDEVMAAITRQDGSELQVETVAPGMQYTKERILGFIRPDDAAPFLQKNLYMTLNSYVTQATRRAEWARRFSDDGQALRDLFDQAAKEGATKEQIADAARYLQGIDGTLGDSIDPKLRRAFGNVMVYQNIRLLPLAIFSSLIDPMGIMVRGGTVGQAFKAFKRGMMEIPKPFKKGSRDDSWTQLAQTMGVIDNAVLVHTIGSSHTQGMVGDTGRKINDTFFKYNLMEQYNTSMRVGATEAAVSFLARHADGTADPHSKRWLAELGLKPGDVVINNGHPLLTRNDFEAHGLPADKAQEAADRMALAVNKWVDGAVLRTNAAHKPVWMNDPHYALIAHLKQFVYSFQQTILKRVVNEARYGNFGPAYSLAAYIPFMIAADMMKGMVVGGGAQPDYKEGWGADDYVWSGVQRAGVFGVGQFGLDVATDIHRGGLGIGALTGPTIEQLGDAVSTVAGPQQFQTFALNALPANSLFDAAREVLPSMER